MILQVNIMKYFLEVLESYLDGHIIFYAIEHLGLKVSKNDKTRNVNLCLFKCKSHIYIL